MILTVQNLINQHIFPGAKLIAGQKGGEHIIQWVNVMEILDAPDSVQPGEFLMTTGFGLEDQSKFGSVIPRLEERGVAALAIQTGYYIDTVPGYIIDQANALGFPIVTLPKHLTISEVLHTLLDAVAVDQGRGAERDVWHQAQHFLIGCLDKHSEAFFPKKDAACTHLILVEPSGYNVLEDDNWTECLGQIRSFLQSNSRLCLWQEMGGRRMVFLLSFQSREPVLPLLYDLNIKLTQLSENMGTNCYLGSNWVENEDDIPIALLHCAESIEALKHIEARRGLCPYESITFVKMFGNLHHNSRSVVLENRPLQVLLNFDRANGTNYVHTLRVYLASSCNVSLASRQLFVHRHTLLKRLAKILSLSGLNLDDYYARIYMSIALLFHDYFAY